MDLVTATDPTDKYYCPSFVSIQTFNLNSHITNNSTLSIIHTESNYCRVYYYEVSNNIFLLEDNRLNNWKFTLKKQALHLPTQLLSLDRIMGGGIPKANLTLIYGEANTGKSSLALQCAVISAKHNLKTIIIDSDNNFSPNRLSQIANYNLNHISPLIFIFKPQSFNEQSLLIEHLDDYISNDVILIIVDTITSHYRLELGQIDKIFSLNRDLNRQIAYLANIAKTHNIAVLLISQVRDVFKNGKQQVEPVANRILKFWAQTILSSRMTKNRAIREVLIEKPSITKNVDARCLFMINKTGIIDLDIQTP